MPGFTLLSQIRLITRKYFVHTNACMANDPTSSRSSEGALHYLFNPLEKCTGIQGCNGVLQFSESHIPGDPVILKTRVTLVR